MHRKKIAGDTIVAVESICVVGYLKLAHPSDEYECASSIFSDRRGNGRGERMLRWLGSARSRRTLLVHDTRTLTLLKARYDLYSILPIRNAVYVFFFFFYLFLLTKPFSLTCIFPCRWLRFFLLALDFCVH